MTLEELKVCLKPYTSATGHPAFYAEFNNWKVIVFIYKTNVGLFCTNRDDSCLLERAVTKTRPTLEGALQAALSHIEEKDSI